MLEKNPFTLSLRKEPKEYILRTAITNEIIDDFESENPVSSVYVLTGVRGSGKTVLLSSLYKYFNDVYDFIAVDLNIGDYILEDLAAAIYSNAPIKHRFLKSEFNFGFDGISVKIKGGNPIVSASILLEKMLSILKKISRLLCL